MIKTLTRLELPNPTVGIDARKRSILREEASGAIKTLKRLERTNPSVRMDRIEPLSMSNA